MRLRALHLIEQVGPSRVHVFVRKFPENTPACLGSGRATSLVLDIYSSALAIGLIGDAVGLGDTSYDSCISNLSAAEALVAIKILR